MVAVDVARLGAALVRAEAGHAGQTRTKSSPTDVVTATDLRSEDLIRRELMARCPGSSIVGEEYGEEIGTNGIAWIVDPIDGTVNFLYDLPVISVSIAASLEGEVVAGAVADVHRGDVYSAARGSGARCNGEAVGCSGIGDLAQSLVATGFAYDAGVRAAQADALTGILPACRDIRCMGSAALNLCWVGDGRLDAYFERDLKVYDYAAGALIAAEGGADVELPTSNDADLTITASPAIFGSLRRLVTSAGG